MKASKNSPKKGKSKSGDAKDKASKKKKEPDKLPNRKPISKVLIRRKKGETIIGKNLIVSKQINNFFKKADQNKTTEQVQKEALENIQGFLKIGKCIEDWKKDPKLASKERKAINQWAKKMLTEQEYNELGDLKRELELPNNYTAAIALLDIRFKEMEEKVKGKQLDAKEMNMSQEEFNAAMSIFEKELKKKEDEDEGYDGVSSDPQVKSHQDFIKQLEDLWGMPYEELVKTAADAGVDPNAMEEESDDQNEEEEEEDDANTRMDKFIDKVDLKDLVDKIGPEIKEEINSINKGEIKLAAQKEDKIGRLVNAVNNRKVLANQVMEIKKSIESNNRVLVLNNIEELKKEILTDNKFSVDAIETLSQAIANDPNATNRELMLAMAVNILAREVKNLNNLTEKLVLTLDAKDIEDTEVKNFAKKPNIVKKVRSGNYLSNEEMSSLTEVNKQLRNIRDFVQMPKWDVWKKFKEDEKKSYFNERIKWNLSRLKFLTDKAIGKENNEYQIDPADIPKALNCHVYYMNKFDTGFQIKQDEWDKLYQAQSEETKTKLCELRILAKSILVKLEKEKKITGVIRYKGEFIQTKGHAYFNLNLEDIFKKKVQYAQAQRPWIYQMPFNKGPQRRYNNKKNLNKKRPPEAKLDDAVRDVDDENFRSKVEGK